MTGVHPVHITAHSVRGFAQFLGNCVLSVIPGSVAEGFHVRFTPQDITCSIESCVDMIATDHGVSQDIEVSCVVERIDESMARVTGIKVLVRSHLPSEYVHRMLPTLYSDTLTLDHSDTLEELYIDFPAFVRQVVNRARLFYAIEVSINAPQILSNASRDSLLMFNPQLKDPCDAPVCVRVGRSEPRVYLMIEDLELGVIEVGSSSGEGPIFWLDPADRASHDATSRWERNLSRTVFPYAQPSQEAFLQRLRDAVEVSPLPMLTPTAQENSHD